jgi:hypothetical protein
MKSAFIHLNVHTNYSLLSGASRVEELLDRAREMGFAALAITDTNGLYGAMLFLSKARELGIKPILGAEIECDSGVAVCLASDRQGYPNLCRVITARQLDENFSLPDALVRHQEGLFILTPDAALLRRLTGRIRDGRLFHEIQYYSDPARKSSRTSRPSQRTTPILLCPTGAKCTVSSTEVWHAKSLLSSTPTGVPHRVWGRADSTLDTRGGPS